MLCVSLFTFYWHHFECYPKKKRRSSIGIIYKDPWQFWTSMKSVFLPAIRSYRNLQHSNWFIYNSISRTYAYERSSTHFFFIIVSCNYSLFGHLSIQFTWKIQCRNQIQRNSWCLVIVWMRARFLIQFTFTNTISFIIVRFTTNIAKYIRLEFVLSIQIYNSS